MMSNVTAGELSRMRAVWEEALPGSATVKRGARTTDNMGGFTVSDATVATVSCRVDLFSQQEVVEKLGERVTGRTLRKISLPYGTSVAIGDRVVISGSTYEVLAVLEEGWEVGKRVVGMELE